MKKMVITWITIVFILTSSLLFIGYNFMKSEEEYKSLESDLIEASRVYVKNDINLAINEEVKIKTDKLLSKGYINSLEVNEDVCKGYVLVKREINNYKYKAYIKCNNYETIA